MGICFAIEPPGFKAQFLASACILETRKPQSTDILALFLLRGDCSRHPLMWELPAGIIGSNETYLTTARQKVLEKTGIDLVYGKMEFVRVVHISYPGGNDFTLYITRQFVEWRPIVAYNTKKHQDAQWMYPRKAILELPLVRGLGDCLCTIFRN
jgi:8-oxo-dGTP pyrophosphatase MutT (NUDIX family)